MTQVREPLKSSARRRGLKRGILDLMDLTHHPMHYRDVTTALKKRGYIIQGRTPDLTINSILSRGQEFERTARGTYKRKSVARIKREAVA